jgi:endonuclease YncB( thermonuclease family)
MQPVTCLILLLGLLASPALAAERLVGRARVIDGDTIVVGNVHAQLRDVAAQGGRSARSVGRPARTFMRELIDDCTVVLRRLASAPAADRSASAGSTAMISAGR